LGFSLVSATPQLQRCRIEYLLAYKQEPRSQKSWTTTRRQRWQGQTPSRNPSNLLIAPSGMIRLLLGRPPAGGQLFLEPARFVLRVLTSHQGYRLNRHRRCQFSFQQD